MFYFVYKNIIFRLHKEKNDIQSTYVSFCFFHETVNSYNLRQPIISLTLFSCFVAQEKHTCWPIKMHVQSKLFYNCIYISILVY